MKQTNDNSEIGCRTIHMRQPIFAFQMDRVGRRSRPSGLWTRVGW